MPRRNWRSINLLQNFFQFLWLPLINHLDLAFGAEQNFIVGCVRSGWHRVKKNGKNLLGDKNLFGFWKTRNCEGNLECPLDISAEWCSIFVTLNFGLKDAIFGGRRTKEFLEILTKFLKFLTNMQTLRKMLERSKGVVQTSMWSNPVIAPLAMYNNNLIERIIHETYWFCASFLNFLESKIIEFSHCSYS